MCSIGKAWSLSGPRVERKSETWRLHRHMLDHMMSIQLHRIMGSVAACGRVFVLMCDHWKALRLRRSRAQSLPPALKSLKRDYVPQQSWFLLALVLQQKQGGADFGTRSHSYVCFRFWPVWHHPHRARPVEKTGCQTFLQRSTQDPAPACERSLDPLLSGKVQTLFRRTDATRNMESALCCGAFHFWPFSDSFWQKGLIFLNSMGRTSKSFAQIGFWQGKCQ